MSEAAEQLRGTLVRGALAQLATSTPAKLLGITLTIVAARMLSPSLYGEFSLAVTIYGISDLLTNPSMFTYFVRTPGTNDSALDSAWTFGAVRGLGLMILFWGLAGPLARLFDGGEGVRLLLQLLSTTFFIAGLRNPWVVKIYHKLDYQRIALVESLGGLGGNLVGLWLLWWTQSPAALAAGLVSSQLVSCAMTWVYAARRPKVMIDRVELLKVWQFARFLLFNNVVIFLLLKLDDVFLGKVAGVAMLGLYSLAYKVANDSVLFLITTLRQVLLPAFVKLVDDQEAFVAAALRAVGTLSAISWGLSAMVFVAAPEIITLISPDERWRGADLVLQALMPFVLIRAVNGVFGSLMLAKGRPQVLSKVSGGQLLALVPLMWAGYEAGVRLWGQPIHGVLGVTLAIALLNYGSNVALMVDAHRALGVSGWRATGLMWLMGPATILGVWLGWWVKSPQWPQWLNMLASMGVVALTVLLSWELIVRLFKLSAWLDGPLSLARGARRRKPKG